MRPGCSCAPTALCDACLEADLGSMRGVARARGQWWAERVIAAGRDRSRAWWPHEGRAAELAREHVANLSQDERLLDRLAAECATEAARRWRR